MPTVKLCKLDQTSAGIRIPIDELRREGLVTSDPGEEIELAGEQNFYLNREGDGVFRLERAERCVSRASD